MILNVVKSLRAVSVNEAQIDEHGFINDRRFMIIVPSPPPLLTGGKFGPNDPTHHFVTQRQCPILATINATLSKDNNELTLSCNNNSVKIPTYPTTTTTTESKYYKARIWDDIVDVIDMGDHVAKFLISIIDQDLNKTFESSNGIRLVTMIRDEDNDEKENQQQMNRRVATDRYVPSMVRTLLGINHIQNGLTDGFPILIVNLKSLQQLNDKLKQQGKDMLDIKRFRPNIVIDGVNVKPFEEDTWKVIRINGIIFHIVKGCPRCKQSCTDQNTGIVYDEPLQTMKTFRSVGPVTENLYFGQNVIPHPTNTSNNAPQILHVGAEVEILIHGQPIWDDS